jgi:hypothetical protein
LRLALRISRLSDARDDLSAALESGTVINLAAGIIMARNRCTRDAAFTALKDASDSRHMKLHDQPAAVAASVSKDAAVNTHFENRERHLSATVPAGSREARIVHAGARQAVGDC